MGFASSTIVDSVWADLSYEADAETPKGNITEGTLWYNSDLKIEILKAGISMVHQMGWQNMHGQKTQMVSIKRTTITFRYANNS